MITVDEQRFKAVLQIIYDSYTHRRNGFALFDAENSAPQTIHKPNCVEFGDKRHLYWFTLVAMSDTRTTSATLYPRFAKMFNRNKTLFRIGYVPKHKRMQELFEHYQIALPRMQIAQFIERKKHLDSVFDGNSLLIYKNARNIDEVMVNLNRIKKEHDIINIFPGAKRKVLTLLAMFLSEFTEFDFDDVVPVDVWVQAIANTTNSLSGEGVIDINSLEQMLRPIVTQVFAEYKKHKGAASATWILGNKFCGNCHRSDTSINCPIYNQCDGPAYRMRHPQSKKLYGRVERPWKPRGKFSAI